MSTKASITSGPRHHLYIQELLSEEPKNVFLELSSPTEFQVTKETFRDQTIEVVMVEIPAEIMDDIALAWIRKRKLEGAVGGPVGAEYGGPDCPYD
ncbi:hypothetical protein [Marinobacter alexandrii]|uniref:hypothetical protein n=1 Tax=Marinobacter alexandrii TaxID=2570351 RepID=UPI001108987A|nr:hypothetical protein [Marinobacter alexandrii]